MALPSQAHYRGPLVNHSGTVTTGGTAVNPLPHNSDRNYLVIQNQHATADLWVDFGAAAVTSPPSLRIPAGAVWVWEDSFIPTDAVYLNSAVAGHPFTLKEG